MYVVAVIVFVLTLVKVFVCPLNVADESLNTIMFVLWLVPMFNCAEFCIVLITLVPELFSLIGVVAVVVIVLKDTLSEVPTGCPMLIAFVFIGSFFFLNLFTGVLFMNFEKAQRDEKDAMHLDGEEIRWVDMMKMICAEQPDIVRIPKGKIRRWCFDLVR